MKQNQLAQKFCKHPVFQRPHSKTIDLLKTNLAREDSRKEIRSQSLRECVDRQN